MKSTLEHYINSIRKDKVFDSKVSFKDLDEYTFYGDGQGDCEKSSNAISNLILLNDYIEYCEKQINLAKEYIKLKRGEIK